MSPITRINPRVLESINQYAQAYASGDPFPHVVIDDLFEESFCDRLISEFPPFERGCTINEHGALGGKSTCENVRALGQTYEQLDDLVRSQDFLKVVSRITGIDDLIYDPDYVGGGTHENRSGQELDPHVDFNYHPRTGWHRRFNAIVYLNPEWKEEWGGSIELHQDPWKPESDRVKSVVPLKNRCVLFETSERSWHGFRAIRPPLDRPDLTRRSFAIYLYTRERPVAQTAAPHATVYVERPLPETVAPGKVLDANSADLVQRLVARRRTHIDRLFEREQAFEKEAVRLIEALLEVDQSALSAEQVQAITNAVALQDELLASLYEREKRFTAMLQEMRRLAGETAGPRRFPLVGAAEVAGDVQGFWPEDRWATGSLVVPVHARADVHRFVVTGFVPEHAPTPLRLAGLAGAREASAELGPGVFNWEIPARLAAGETGRLTILAAETWSPVAVAVGSDDRQLSFLLKRITAS
jgi:Rps23 Pro-64 3,4-dihydroxylase Tpa1-like proline 4-hydroxylase